VKATIISFTLLLINLSFIQATLACSLQSNVPDLPPGKMPAYKKAQAIINSGNPAKGTTNYYQELYDRSKYIYVGRVTLLLDRSDRADEAKADDSLFAYIKISKGWKSGKVRDIRLKIPKDGPLCNHRYAYQLKEKQRYLFFENRKGLITALPIVNNPTSDHFSTAAIKQYGRSDWYYSRNTTIHYNSQ
jgi:hypothetical protein